MQRNVPTAGLRVKIMSETDHRRIGGITHECPSPLLKTHYLSSANVSTYKQYPQLVPRPYTHSLFSIQIKESVQYYQFETFHEMNS